ncbi:signal peptidase I [Halarsenatibacter silvermanii]|uniref:Signal peptidase I n=1 Tax=Halarsenatibacter silvermanii TaxID=321763 RepID=A0A1G9JT03_9FIRM|nr:signal peptidase I [Halarsenatibacter silvermanii]
MDKRDLIEIVQSLAIAAVLAFLIITFVAQSFVVEGSSMEETLQHGERLIVNKLVYRFSEPDRGEIVVFTPGEDEDNRYIKRIIGVPGDTVYIQDDQVYVNGEPIEEEYIREEMREVGETGPFEVPENSYFVLGDNRNHSADSRFPNLVGYVDRDKIHGRALWVFWPLNEMRLVDHAEYSLEEKNNSAANSS